MGDAPTAKSVEAAWSEGRLLAYECGSCKKTQTSPMVRCGKCGSTRIGAKHLPSAGKVLSHTIQRVAAADFIKEVPYAFVVVELDDGTRVTGWIAGITSDAELPQGQPVRVFHMQKAGLSFEKT